MSLVGPRPCIPYETENFAPHHFERFLVRPGMTGLWQVDGACALDLRRGARHGRRLCAQLVARPRPAAALPYAARDPAAGDGLDAHDRATQRAASASSASATGARTSSATSTSCPRPRCACVCDQRPEAFERDRAALSGDPLRRPLRRAARRPDLDAVAIATPVSTHYELARRALEAGKHVFVEKPLAASTEEAIELAELAREPGSC